MEIEREKRKGETLTLFNAVLWAFFPVVTIFSYAILPSLVSLAWSTLFAAIFFAGVMTYTHKWHELKNPTLWKYSFWIALFIGVLFYGFFFLGLERTTAGNAAIITQFEVFTMFFLFHVLRGERMSIEYKIGSALMVLGALIVLAKDFTHFNVGDILILIATFCSPLGNLYQQKARAFASSESIMFLRSLLSLPPVFAVAYFFYGNIPSSAVYDSLPVLILNGVLFLGISKIIFIESIHRISVTKAIALGSITPLLTLIAAWPLLDQIPNIWQLISLLPILLGVFLLTDNIKFKNTYSTQ